MIVVFDTNIWKAQLYLQSPQAAAVRFFLNHHRAKVGLPEVIREEVKSHVKREILESISTIKGDHKRLLGMFRSLKELVLPTETEVEAVVSIIFDSLGVEHIDVPFSLESARSSFTKVINKKAPSNFDDQFKDGVLWADCLKLLDEDDVVLVTGDKAFYCDRDVKKGLAPNLISELANARHQLTILPELGALLDQIQSPVSLDNDALAALCLGRQKNSVIKLVSENGFELGERASLKRKVFATEDARMLFVQFSAEYTCPSLTLDRDPAVLTIGGDCRHNIDNAQFDQFRPQIEELKFRSADGAETTRKVVFASINFVLGHKDVTHSVKYELSG